MSAELTLVRHGPSAHVHSGWIDSAGFGRWREAYEAAGIVADATPPAALRQFAERAGVLVASDAPRAFESARRLAPARQVVASTLLREIELPAPSLGRLALPLPAWAVAVGIYSAVRRRRALHPAPADVVRVGEASRWLAALAEEHGSLVAVTHASLRPLLVRSLGATGWRTRGQARSLRTWSAWTLVRDP